MAATIAYIVDDTYKDAVRNPVQADGTWRLPSRQLRQLFKNNSARPVEALQILVGRGAVDATAFGLGLKNNDAAARDALADRPAGPLSHVWAADQIERRFEMASILAVRADCARKR